MENSKIIDDLKTILKYCFIKELINDGRSSYTNVKPTDVFERWYKTTERICKKDDSLIASLCLRITQAGYPCYPIKDEYVFTGIKSNLKDYEIKNVLYGLENYLS